MRDTVATQVPNVIDAQLSRSGPSTKRVGLVGLERVPVREGAVILDAQGHKLGVVTSGTLAPTVDEPIAMAYLAANHALPRHEVYAEVQRQAAADAGEPQHRSRRIAMSVGKPALRNLCKTRSPCGLSKVLSPR